MRVVAAGRSSAPSQAPSRAGQQIATGQRRRHLALPEPHSIPQVEQEQRRHDQHFRNKLHAYAGPTGAKCGQHRQPEAEHDERHDFAAPARRSAWIARWPQKSATVTTTTG
jgi:hypothetical protein